MGVTFDVGHALIAGECPAAACALIADAGKLFYTHFNDNGTDWDWDMIPGSVHVWDLLETLYYLQRADWSGWLSYDVVTRSGDDLVGVQVATMRVMQAAEKLLKKIGRERMDAMIARGAPARECAGAVGGVALTGTPWRLLYPHTVSGQRRARRPPSA